VHVGQNERVEKTRNKKKRGKEKDTMKNDQMKGAVAAAFSEHCKKKRKHRGRKE